MQPLEQLYELEEVLLDEYVEGEGVYKLITLYEKMRRAAKTPEEQLYVRRKLLMAYVDYGTYLKTSKEKDSFAAKIYLKKALALESGHATAHYRLGFLAYEAQQYSEALRHFEQAIGGELKEHQMLYAHMYLTNSALHIAEQTKRSLEQLEIEAKPIPYEMSPYYELIAHNEAFLNAQAFCQITREETVFCSKDRCEQLVFVPPTETLLLYFGDRETICSYNRQEVALENDSARLLLHLLMETDAQQPATRLTTSDYFLVVGHNQQVSPATFRQRISRLRRQLRFIGVEEAIVTARHHSETAYYARIPFIVLCRSDSSEAEPYITV